MIIANKKSLLAHIILVISIATSTYFYNYQYPNKVFWDENYHIASAYKYLNNTMFMETHPPLGKLFIALGEFILDPNRSLDTSNFSQTDYIKKFPDGFSFTGVRLFPALFATLSSILFFLILYTISKKIHLSFLFTSLYLFSNAYIVHSRAAMLEPIQMFFIFSTVLYFLYVLEREKKGTAVYFILGMLIGLAVSVKLNGLILLLLYPFLYFYNFKTHLNLPKSIAAFIFNGIVLLAGIIIVFSTVFYIHFSLGEQLGKKNYNASEQYKKILTNKNTSNIYNFPTMMQDHLEYFVTYTKNVPKYDPCKKKGENGSLATTWPFGNKSINYRWEKKDGKVQYLYLQSNPIIWFSVLLSVILAFILVIGKFIFHTKITDKRLFYIISTFLAMYFSYMLVMFNANRVMYLYHYFIPLYFGAFILFLMYLYIFKEDLENNSILLKSSTYLFILQVLYVYWFFRVFTYYIPIDSYEFIQRDWFEFWKLRVIT